MYAAADGSANEFALMAYGSYDVRLRWLRHALVFISKAVRQRSRLIRPLHICELYCGRGPSAASEPPRRLTGTFASPFASACASPSTHRRAKRGANLSFDRILDRLSDGQHDDRQYLLNPEKHFV